MKKLNRKGFTLVELLAVIVILAIVVGIAIPSVTSIINGSKNSALGVAVETAVDYLQDQYDIFNIDSNAAGALINRVVDETYVELKTGRDDASLKELGFDPANVNIVYVEVAHNPATNIAAITVTVAEIPTNSDYFATAYWTPSGTKATPKASSGVENVKTN